jgi:hypothetical protein
MSIIERAKDELKRVNFGEKDSKVMIEILEKFFDQWDSGGAVWAVAPVLQRLIAGKCLSPLTGEDDEWREVGQGVYQNKRLGSVFKDPRYHDGKIAYDLDNPTGSRVAITFPYYPEHAEVASPIVTIDTDSLNDNAQAPLADDLKDN